MNTFASTKSPLGWEHTFSLNLACAYAHERVTQILSFVPQGMYVIIFVHHSFNGASH